MTNNQQPIERTQGAASTNSSYLEWGPVWAGALIAVAISTILIQFGAAAGLALGDAIRPDNTVSYNFIATSLWVLLVSLASSAAAGYIAGRMRMTMNDAVADEVEFRDGVHGITAWAAATLIVAVFVTITGSIGSALVTTASTEAPKLSVELQNWAANQALIVAFATAAGSALGAAAAWFASVSGGNHRDEGTSHNLVVPSMFRKSSQ